MFFWQKKALIVGKSAVLFLPARDLMIVNDWQSYLKVKIVSIFYGLDLLETRMSNLYVLMFFLLIRRGLLMPHVYRCYINYQKSIMQIQYEDEQRQSLVSSKQSKEQKYNSIYDREEDVTPTPQQMPQEIVHKVIYGDTLEGLSLQYDVPIGKIRYRNNIEGDSIYHLKEIIIPDPRVKPMEKERTQEILIEEFVGHMDYSEKSRKVARYYLDENNWNMKEAVKQYRDDLEWQRKNRDKILTRPIDGPGLQMTDIKKYYEKLGQKKKTQ